MLAYWAHFCFVSLILQTSLGLVSVRVWKYWFSHFQFLNLYVIDLVTCRNQLAIFWISVKWITWRNRQKCEGRKFSQMPFQTHWNVQLWRLTIINLSVDVWQWQLQQGANGKVETRLKTNAAALISRHFLNSAIPYLSICSRKMIPYVYIKVFKKKDSLFLLCFLP